ncbi:MULTISPECIES: biotin-dependent carboxyltransferase family protein [unclassified Gordonia (in: high G+C Gram-positive bacteria)]|uniref:5-oxoprolinase subunit C family protein n=1 Tax=unclassified Gordonia (in: high G+C Gram-positive bacteria) TaxID=2657482 RepID=UPI0009AC4C3C|nr:MULTISPECIES: biotin-dependent carboxyltransferase family protein [unclassified Gordonia (in: high G+C Gram-positive bacteria)]MDF3282799.1 biotin-dependent carboxyltransferase family protein [Gordonia sp. N1V]OPX16371.1 allophanate hydrolase [Gordonia sp. i37]
MSAIEVIHPGPFATIQDLGRPGLAHLGVPRSGAADLVSMTLANRLVGNRESAAVIEATLGGIRIRALRGLLIAVTGAGAQVLVDDVPVGLGATVTVTAGSELAVSAPTWGCRNYVAVRGGIDVGAVLGSRSTDTLSGLGPPPLSAGDLLEVGIESGPWPAVTHAPVEATPPPVAELDVSAGPRSGHLHRVGDLMVGEWVVSADADRVGVRLVRPDESDHPLLHHRADVGELASEGVAHGAVQVPPNGQPVLFLADHPVTGGYPVVAVLTAGALARVGQLVAGNRVRFRSR